MTNFNFEGQPEGDWEDRGNLSWSEVDWLKFLQRQDKEIARFLGFYDQCASSATERLDWIARQMGWDSEDWSVSEISDDEEGEDWNPESDDEHLASDTDPYTLHRHPVYVVCAGIFLQLRYTLRQILEKEETAADKLLTWDFSESLGEAEKHSLMAMQSMDIGDYLLCVVHLKRAMRGINLAMSLLPNLFPPSLDADIFQKGIVSRLFDLREVFLRVMNDCREEDRREFRD